MSKYDWSTSPEWVQWAATDADGALCVYEHEPYAHDDHWARNGGRMSEVWHGQPRGDWAHSLEHRPPVEKAERADRGTHLKLRARVLELEECIRGALRIQALWAPPLDGPRPAQHYDENVALASMLANFRASVGHTSTCPAGIGLECVCELRL